MDRGFVVFAPKLRLARAQALSVLAEILDEARGLALPYPLELKGIVQAYIKGRASWEDVESKVRKLLGVYSDAWLKIEEPLLKGLRELAPPNIIFTATAQGVIGGFTSALKLLSYALRLRLGARVNPREVYYLATSLRPFLGFEPGLAAKGYAVLVSSTRIAEVLAEKFKLVSAMPGYVETPLEELIWASEEEVLEALNRYTSFVFDYLITSRDPDEAYLRWIIHEHPQSPLAREARKLLPLLRRGP